MADDTIPSTPPAAATGGNLEPVDRVAVARERFQTPADGPVRYEVRDPFAETTHRGDDLGKMIAKAEQVGTSRVVEIDGDGKRTPIHRVDGKWLRDEVRPARPERPLDTTRDAEGAPNNDRTSAQQARPGERPETATTRTSAAIDADAERVARVGRLEAELAERFIVKRSLVSVGKAPVTSNEYRFRGDASRVAFTESTFRLSTDSNNPAVARSMVDLAETRNWKGLRVSGHEDFKRMVWLEATVRGVKAVGYEPSKGDIELANREREARQLNRIEPDRQAASADASAAAGTSKGSARGSGGRKAVLAAIEAVLVDRKVPEEQRDAVMAAAAEKLAERIRAGQAPKVKVYDRAAPPQRPTLVPTPEMQRSRERASPAPAR